MVLVRPAGVVSVAAQGELEVDVEGHLERLPVVQGLQLLQQGGLVLTIIIEKTILMLLSKDTFQGYKYWNKHICTMNVSNTELRRKLY